MARTRTRRLNDVEERDGRYVLYRMQQSQRAWQNPALELAIREANERRLPVVVAFGLMADYPEANARHCAFLLQDLTDVSEGLRQRGIAFVLRRGAPPEVGLELSGDAAMVICDRGYLRHQKQWRRCLARKAAVPVVQVEGDVVIPVDEASSKQEVAARTLRPKIHELLDRYLVEHKDGEVGKSSRRIGLQSDIDPDKVDKTLHSLGADGSVLPHRCFRGGTVETRGNSNRFCAATSVVTTPSREIPRGARLRISARICTSATSLRWRWRERSAGRSVAHPRIGRGFSRS
jgi:deoxyribodipyrimidine photo-lyase